MGTNFYKEKGIIGIVGGMGPEAGIALFNAILRFTGARTDQQHLSTILISFPAHIMDRTAYLDGLQGINPAYGITQVIRRLETVGADVVGIACNTSHSPAIFDVITAELARSGCRVELLHMPREACAFIKEAYPLAKRIGVMTTNGTYRSGIYRNCLQNLGYKVIVPDEEFQDAIIHRMIYDPCFGLKSTPGHVTEEVRCLFNEAIHFFMKHHADAIILGCTELSLLFPAIPEPGIPLIDATDSLARALIREVIR